MFKRKYYLTIAAWMALAVAFGANVCTWKGGSGKFSDNNWDVAPTSGNGDTIVIDTTDGNPITIENDLVDDFTIGKIRFISSRFLDKVNPAVKPGSVTLTGKRIYIPSDASASIIWDHGDTTDEYVRGPEVIVEAPFRFKSGHLNISWNHVFNGDITIDDGGYLYFDWPGSLNFANTQNYPGVVINGDILGPNASINAWLGQGGRGNTLLLNGKVVLKSCLSSVSGNLKTTLELANPLNEIDFVSLQYGYVNLMKAGCVSEKTVIEHKKDEYGPGEVRIKDGETIVINTIKSSDPNSSKKIIVRTLANNPETFLHIKADQDTYFDGIFTKSISVIYNPKGNYTFTFASVAASETVGTLDIQGGTFKFANEASFANAESIIVRDSAVMDFTDSQSANPVSENNILNIRKGAKLKIPEGKELRVGKLLYKGVYLSPATYTSASSDWIEGGGSVVVTKNADAGVKTWANDNGGEWSTSSNWSPNGVPDVNTSQAYMTSDSDIEVEADADVYEFGRLYIGDKYTAGINKLKIAKDAFFKNGTSFTVDKNGVYEQNAGYVSISNLDNVVEVKNGGIWRINGGTNVLHTLTLATGPLSVEDGGLVEVQGGTLKLESMKDYYPSFYLSGGKMVVSGNATLDVVNEVSPHNNGIHTHGWGEIVCKENSLFKGVAIGISVPNKKLIYRFRDNARVDLQQNLLGGYSRYMDVLLDFGSSNTQSRIPGKCLFGANYSSRTEAIVREKAVMPRLAQRVIIGGYMQTAGFGYSANPYGICPTGIVTVAGTFIFNSASSENDKINGISIGSTSCELDLKGAVWSKTTTWPYGELNIEPTGFLSNANYCIALGVGYGEGRLNVRGGKVVHDQGHFLVGAGEGLGRVTLVEGASCSLKSAGYVGGFSPAELGFTGWPSKYPSEALTSTGIVSVVDGTLDFIDTNLNIGLKGTAIINVGTNGFISAGNINLANSVDTVLNFTLCENGGGSIKALGTLSVGDNVKIKVDATELPLKSVTLIEAAQWAGEFEAEDIELVMQKESLGSVRRVGTSLKFLPNTFTTIIIR